MVNSQRGNGEVLDGRDIFYCRKCLNLLVGNKACIKGRSGPAYIGVDNVDVHRSTAFLLQIKTPNTIHTLDVGANFAEYVYKHFFHHGVCALNLIKMKRSRI